MNINKEKFKNKYRIKSARLPYWDYAADGYYFVTICTKNRSPYFGFVKNNKMHFSKIGEIIREEWLKIPQIRKNIIMDEYVIMPNHIHGILIINGNRNNGPIQFTKIVENYVKQCQKIISCRDEAEPHLYRKTDINYYSKISPKSDSLPTIIGSFKSAVTKKIRRIHYDFCWQSGYYDTVIRNEKSLFNIRYYILNNVANWHNDSKFKI